MTLKYLAILFCSLSLLLSCSTRTSYDLKNGGNDIIIYKDSFITIQRSTEVLGDELFVSHLVTKNSEFKNEEFAILNISDTIEKIQLKDSLSFYESCTFKKYWYKSFAEIPLSYRNLQNCNSYQVIYYFNFKEISNRSIVIKTNTKFSAKQLTTSTDIIDTLLRNTTHHISQP